MKEVILQAVSIQSFVWFFHIAGAVVWVGSMVYAGFIVAPVLKKDVPEKSDELIIKMDTRFRGVGWACAIILVLTGFYMGWGRFSENLYGKVLYLKLFAVILIFFLGSYLDFVVAPALKTNPGLAGRADLIGKLCFLLLFGVLFLAGVLTAI